MKKLINELYSKVKDCKNTNTIYDTRKYILLSDAEKMLKQALNNPVVNKSTIEYCNLCKKDTEHRIIHACNICERNL